MSPENETADRSVRFTPGQLEPALVSNWAWLANTMFLNSQIRCFLTHKYDFLKLTSTIF